MNNDIEISIVIVTYNSSKFIINCLNSIYKNNSNVKLKIFIIDNNSTDDTAKLIKNNFKDIYLEENKNNIGFAAANNLLLKIIKTKYILLLNPDTLFIDNSIEKMLFFIQENKDIGIVGPKVLNSNFTTQLSNTKFPSIFNLLLETFFMNGLLFNNLLAIFRKNLKIKYVDYLQGSCLLLKKDVLDEIGLFDERYFMYFEETDLCLRAKRKNWKIAQYLKARIIHFGCGEEGYYDENRIINYHKSLLKFYIKNYGKFSIKILSYIIYLRSLIRISVLSLSFLIKNTDKKMLKSKIMGYKKVLTLTI